MTGSGLLVIGIGNEDRSDDACGRWVARQLRGRVAARVEESNGEATELLEMWTGVSTAIVIDAMRSGSTPGTVRRFSFGGAGGPGTSFATSTHGFGLAEAWGLAHALGRAPDECRVYGIEVGSISNGRGLTPRVEQAVRAVADQILADVADAPLPPGRPGGVPHA